MIVEFSVKNFRSIKDLQTISFLATGLRSPQDFEHVDEGNIEMEGDSRLLKTIGIYGANASGKSNIMLALHFFILSIKGEPSTESQLGSLFDPFLFQDKPLNSEVFFQMVLILEGKKYRYGFTVKKNYDLSQKENKSNEIISSEWLFGPKERNVVELFRRVGTEVSKERLPGSDSIPPLQYEHSLFLTHAAAFDSTGLCAIVRSYFKGWTVSNVTNSLVFRRNSIRLIEQENRKSDLLELLYSFGIKYDNVVLDRDPNKPDEILQHDKVLLTKPFLNSRNEAGEVKLNLMHNESAGTRKLFDIAGLLLRAFNLHRSALIVFDEIDSNFHPSLLIRLVSLFNNKSINKSKSQLLFTSHDTNLMAPSIMRRDQFYFTEKSDDNSTRLYALSDLKGIRNDADFAKQYLAGFYGALPILDTYLDEPNIARYGAMES